MQALCFFISMVCVVAYAIKVLELQRRLENFSPDYWVEIGSPRGYSVRSRSAIARVLFSARLRQVCAEVGMSRLLLEIRMLCLAGSIALLCVIVLHMIARNS